MRIQIVCDCALHRRLVVVLQQANAVAIEGRRLLELEHERGHALRTVGRGAANPDGVARLLRALKRRKLAALKAAVEAVEDVLEPPPPRTGTGEPAERSNDARWRPVFSGA